ncbi:MAG: outer membrane beta-barrel protein [Bacteroidota bacterium]
MQENEFEKQVKQRMDEFRLRPSEPVWTEIEKELRDKRRRRFILIPLFAVLSATGYFAWQTYFPANKISSSAKEISTKNNSNTDQNKNVFSKNPDKINIPGDEVSNETSEKTTALKNTKEGSSAVKNSENTSKEEKNTHNKTVSRKKESRQMTAGNNPLVSLKKAEKTDDTSDKVTLVKTNKDKKINDQYKNETDLNNRLTEKNTDFKKLYLPGEPAEAELTSGNNIERDNRPVIVNYRLFSTNLFTDSIAANKLTGLQLPSFKNPDLAHSSHGIKLGINFSIGASSRVNKPLQLSSEEKSTARSALYAGVNSPSFNNIGGGVSILPPSDVTPGVAFRIGAIAMKPLSKRFDISAGLQYSYSSDRIRVGKSIASPSSFTGAANLDVLAQAYYPNVQNVNHTNKYHFIELPVSVYYNLNRKWKTPFVWNAGISAGRLVSSDVLLYDITWGGIYYKGDKNIRKTQVNISTGFSIRVTGSNRWQWNIGPQVYMGVTKLFQSEYDKNKHPLYGGLNVQVLLPAKKKNSR